MSNKSNRSGSHSSSQSSQHYSSRSETYSRPKAYSQECLDQAYQSLSDLMEHKYSIQQYTLMSDDDRPLPNVWEGTDGFMKHLHGQFPMPRLVKAGISEQQEEEDKEPGSLTGRHKNLKANSEAKKPSTNSKSNEEEGDDLFVVMDICGNVDNIETFDSVIEEDTIRTERDVENDDLMMALSSATSGNVKSVARSSPAAKSSSKHTSVREAAVSKENPDAAPPKSGKVDKATTQKKDEGASTLSPLAVGKSNTWTKSQLLERIYYNALGTDIDPKKLKATLQERLREFDKAINNLSDRYHTLRNLIQKKFKEIYVLSEIDLLKLGEIGRLFCGLFSEMEALRMTLNPNNSERGLVFPHACKLASEETADFEKQFKMLVRKLRDLSIDHNALLNSESLMPVISEFNVNRGCDTVIRTTALFFFNQAKRLKRFFENKLLVYNVSQMLVHCSSSEDNLLFYENRKRLSVTGNLYLEGHLISSDKKMLKRKSTSRPEDLQSFESSHDHQSQGEPNSFQTIQRDGASDNVSEPPQLGVNPYGNPDEITTQIFHRNPHASTELTHLRCNRELLEVTSKEQPKESQERLPKLPSSYPTIPKEHKDDPGFNTETYRYYDKMVEEWKYYNNYVKKRLHVISGTDKPCKDRVGFCADMVKLSGIIQNLTVQFEENRMVQPKDNKSEKWAFSPDVIADIGINATKYLSSKFSSLWLNLRSVHSFFKSVFYKNCEIIQSYNESLEAELKGQVVLPDKTRPLGNKAKKGHYNSRGGWVRHRGGKSGNRMQSNSSGQFTDPQVEHEDYAAGYRASQLFHGAKQQNMRTQSFDERGNYETGFENNLFSNEWGGNEIENKSYTLVQEDNLHLDHMLPQHQTSVPVFEKDQNRPRFSYPSEPEGDFNKSYEFNRHDISKNTFDEQQDYDNASYQQETDYRISEQHVNETFYEEETKNDYNQGYDKEVESTYNYDERHGEGYHNGDWEEEVCYDHDTIFQRQPNSLYGQQVRGSSADEGSTPLFSRESEGFSQTFPSTQVIQPSTSSMGASQFRTDNVKFFDQRYSQRYNQPMEENVNAPRRKPQTSQSYEGVDPAKSLNMDCKCGCSGTVLDDFPTRPPPGLQNLGPEAQYWVRMSLVSYDISRLSSLLGKIVGLFNKMKRDPHRDGARAMVNMCATLPLLAAGIRHGQRDQQAKGFSEDMPYTESEVTELGLDKLPILAINSFQVERELYNLYHKFNTVFRERKNVIIRFNAHAENFCTVRNRAFNFTYQPEDMPDHEPVQAGRSQSMHRGKSNNLGDFGISSNKESSQEKIAYYQTMLSVQKQVTYVRDDIRVLDKMFKKEGMWNMGPQQQLLQKLTAFDAKLIDSQKTMTAIEPQRGKFGKFVPKYIQSLLKVGGAHKKTIDNHIKNYDFILKMIAWGMRELRQFIETLDISIQHQVLHLQSMKVEVTGSC